MHRIAELVGIRAFRLAEAPLPEPGPGEVRVRVLAVGICGSDRHAYAEGGVGGVRNHYPMVLGHEPAGAVDRLGPGVTGLAVGDLVACEPSIFCYHCEFCRGGRHNLCSNLRFLSSGGEPGFFREHVVLPAKNAVPLPQALTAVQGALVEPLAIALHSMEFAAVAAGDTVAVVGAGPIGLLTVAVCKLRGARRVLAFEPLAHRRDLALAMGADAAFDPREADPGKTAARETGGRGVDVAIDCAAVGRTSNQCIDMARAGGRVVYTGIHAEDEVALDFHQWRRKELVLHQVRRANRETDTAVELLAREIRRFAPLLTHERPLGAIADAFSIIDEYHDGVGKLMIRPDLA